MDSLIKNNDLIKLFSKIEYDLAIENKEKYQDISAHAVKIIELIRTSIGAILEEKANDFLLYYAAIYKHYTLALLSILRLQETQANLNIRQIIEAGACASYSLANPLYYTQHKQPVISIINDKTREKAYKWLEKNHKSFSDFLKKSKDIINPFYAHGGLFTACLGQIDIPTNISFTDKEDPNAIQLNLWHLSSTTIALMHMFFQINKTYNLLQFHEDFEKMLQELKEESDQLKLKIKIKS